MDWNKNESEKWKKRRRIFQHRHKHLNGFIIRLYNIVFHFFLLCHRFHYKLVWLISLLRVPAQQVEWILIICVLRLHKTHFPTFSFHFSISTEKFNGRLNNKFELNRLYCWAMWLSSFCTLEKKLCVGVRIHDFFIGSYQWSIATLL